MKNLSLFSTIPYFVPRLSCTRLESKYATINNISTRMFSSWATALFCRGSYVFSLFFPLSPPLSFLPPPICVCVLTPDNSFSLLIKNEQQPNQIKTNATNKYEMTIYIGTFVYLFCLLRTRGYVAQRDLKFTELLAKFFQRLLLNPWSFCFYLLMLKCHQV